MPSLTSIIIWIVLGLVAGMIAKFIMPGRQGGGFILTTILGIVGAILGGWLYSLITGVNTAGGLNIISFVTAIVGALIVLVIFGLVTKRR